MSSLYGIFIGMLLLAGSALLLHLGAGSVPGRLKPLADAWGKYGGSPKSLNLFLWGVFALMAGGVFLYIGFFLYKSILALGGGH
jgi:hypothetical protein